MIKLSLCNFIKNMYFIKLFHTRFPPILINELINWLIIYCVHVNGVTHENLSFTSIENVTTGRKLQNSVPGVYGIWARRDLYRATPAVTHGLGFAVSIEGPLQCSLLRQPTPLIGVPTWLIFLWNTSTRFDLVMVGFIVLFSMQLYILVYQLQQISL